MPIKHLTNQPSTCGERTCPECNRRSRIHKLTDFPTLTKLTIAKRLNYAKQSQFAGRPNEYNLCQNKELRTKNDELRASKTKPIKPNQSQSKDGKCQG
jgi:hypothetical protein